MLRPEQNALVTESGPQTPMGDVFRRYWIPTLLAEELPEPDCPPVRVTLLSERLLAFRDSEGRLGLISEFCAHRRVSLWFGRNEEGGIRCPYHGWKYDVTGQCVDVPSEPKESGFCETVKLAGYPLVEKGGVLWAYLGPKEAQPPLPEFEWMALPESRRYVSKRFQECNYLQAMEGGIDASHVSFLHSGELHTDPLHRNTKGAEYQKDTKPKYEIHESAGGLLIGARRNADPGNYYWRITQWIMPWYTMVPPYGDNALNSHAWVPVDDTNCFAWTITYHPTRDLTEEELSAMRDGKGIHANLIPGSFRTVANRANDYFMDRAAQKSGRLYSGVAGIAMQDASLQESMGPVVDRSLERLVSTDDAIIKARQRLLRAAKALQTEGQAPAGVEPVCHRVRSATFVLPVDQEYHKARADAFVAKEGVPHTSI
ncbi:MAG TPA: Rieske 2Fe-2S domain-containing protein [Stellaceae bacterium]|jgi:phenylpropionate dioxygenase-like ring-hydroxylating dioxygenase large terminal subunit|nr:Rieske 2Fe-2S domain-containing protein [Stellaceae bacterium]